MLQIKWSTCLPGGLLVPEGVIVIVIDVLVGGGTEVLMMPVEVREEVEIVRNDIVVEDTSVVEVEIITKV